MTNRDPTRRVPALRARLASVPSPSLTPLAMRSRASVDGSRGLLLKRAAPPRSPARSAPEPPAGSHRQAGRAEPQRELVALVRAASTRAGSGHAGSSPRARASRWSGSSPRGSNCAARPMLRNCSPAASSVSPAASRCSRSSDGCHPACLTCIRRFPSCRSPLLGMIGSAAAILRPDSRPKPEERPTRLVRV